MLRDHAMAHTPKRTLVRPQTEALLEIAAASGCVGIVVVMVTWFVDTLARGLQ